MPQGDSFVLVSTAAEVLEISPRQARRLAQKLADMGRASTNDRGQRLVSIEDIKALRAGTLPTTDTSGHEAVIDGHEADADGHIEDDRQRPADAEGHDRARPAVMDGHAADDRTRPQDAEQAHTINPLDALLAEKDARIQEQAETIKTLSTALDQAQKLHLATLTELQQLKAIESMESVDMGRTQEDMGGRPTDTDGHDRRSLADGEGRAADDRTRPQNTPEKKRSWLDIFRR